MTKRLKKTSATPGSSAQRRRARLIGVAVVTVVAMAAIWLLAKPTENSLSLGQTAPDFTLANALGGEVHLADYFGKQAVLIYFSMGPG